MFYVFLHNNSWFSGFIPDNNIVLRYSPASIRRSISQLFLTADSDAHDFHMLCNICSNALLLLNSQSCFLVGLSYRTLRHETIPSYLLDVRTRASHFLCLRLRLLQRNFVRVWYKWLIIQNKLHGHLHYHWVLSLCILHLLPLFNAKSFGLREWVSARREFCVLPCFDKIHAIQASVAATKFWEHLITTSLRKLVRSRLFARFVGKPKCWE